MLPASFWFTRRVAPRHPLVCMLPVSTLLSRGLFDNFRGIAQVWMLPCPVVAFSRRFGTLRGISQVSMLPLSVSVRTARPAPERRVLPLVCAAGAPHWPLRARSGRPRHHLVWMRPLSVSVSDSPPVLSLPGALTLSSESGRWPTYRPVVTLSGGPVPHLSGHSKRLRVRVIDG